MDYLLDVACGSKKMPSRTTYDIKRSGGRLVHGRDNALAPYIRQHAILYFH